jgi:hypothetical protein
MFTRIIIIIAGLLLALPTVAKQQINVCVKSNGQLVDVVVVTVGSEPVCSNTTSPIKWNAARESIGL